MNRLRWIIGISILLLLLFAASCTQPSPGNETTLPAVSAEGQVCLSCHQSITPGIVQDWRDSKHDDKGIDCLACHGAAGKDEERPVGCNQSGHAAYAKEIAG